MWRSCIVLPFQVMSMLRVPKEVVSEVLETFDAELLALSRLSTPNIVKVLIVHLIELCTVLQFYSSTIQSKSSLLSISYRSNRLNRYIMCRRVDVWSIFFIRTLTLPYCVSLQYFIAFVFKEKSELI